LDTLSQNYSYMWASPDMYGSMPNKGLSKIALTLRGNYSYKEIYKAYTILVVGAQFACPKEQLKF
jgi:hypothetical protein